MDSNENPSSSSAGLLGLGANARAHNSAMFDHLSDKEDYYEDKKVTVLKFVTGFVWRAGEQLN